MHPHLFRSILGREPAISEYQVHQTAAGAEITLCVEGAVDGAALSSKLEQALSRSGCVDPHVTVTIVEEIPRLETGKVKRFLPAEASPSGSRAARTALFTP